MTDLQILTHPGRKPLDWSKPPKRDVRVSSNIVAGNGVRITGSFFVLCALQWTMLRVLKSMRIRLHIVQPPYSDGELSAGTHDFDYLFDLVPEGGITSLEQGYALQNKLRRLGWMCWFRHTGTWAAKSRWHIHGAPLPPDGHNFPTEVGIYVDGGLSQDGRISTSSQIQDYWNHSLGLKGQHASGMDKAPSRFPKDIKATVFDFGDYVATKQKEMAA